MEVEGLENSTEGRSEPHSFFSVCLRHPSVIQCRVASQHRSFEITVNANNLCLTMCAAKRSKRVGMWLWGGKNSTWTPKR